MPARKSITYRVVPADVSADREVIVAVNRRNFPASPWDGERFDWYYQNHPAGPGRVWLLVAEPGEQVVGAAGLGVRRLRIGPDIHRVGITAETAVDSEHRSVLPALKLQKEIIALAGHDLSLIYGAPNPVGNAVFRRAGYQEAGALRRWVKPLRISPYLNRHPRLAPFARPLQKPADIAWRLLSSDTWHWKPGVTLTPLTEFDARFDALWEKAAPSFSVIGERRAPELHWRFNQIPGLTYTTVGLLAKGGDDLMGYAVYAWEEGHVVCKDLFAVPQVLPMLLVALIRHVRSTNAISLTLTGNLVPYYEECLKRFGFVLREDEDPLALLAVGDSDHPALHAKERDGWLFLEGDRNFN